MITNSPFLCLHLTHKLKTKLLVAQSHLSVDPRDGNMHPGHGGDEASWVYGDSFSREETRGDFPGGPVAETMHSQNGGWLGPPPAF